MSDPDKKVSCEHGEGVATYVCQHLATGVACGYHASDEESDDPWPDAWCDHCEAARVREGGAWNDVSEGEAKISMQCNHCYDEAKERNATVPAPLKAGQLSTSAESLRILIDHTSAHGKRLQAESKRRFNLGGHERWGADYEAGLFKLTHEERTEVVADVQIVGSFSKKTNSWLWSWANETNGPHLVRDVVRLSTLGQVRGIACLEDEYHENVDEVHGWELTSVACYVLGYEAMYRAPMDHRLLFMILKNLRWIS